jgi:Ca-activated chloride channel homolog
VSFSSPLLLLALLVVPAIFVFALGIDRRRSRYAVEFTNVEVLAAVVDRRRSWRRWIPVVLLLLALATAAGALARPNARLSVPASNRMVIFLVDVSGSMRAGDLEPTRLDAAVTAMRSFLNRVPSSLQVGLVAFSSQPQVLAPPTADHQLVREQLGYLAPESATALGDGLAAAVKLAVSSLARAGVHHQRGKYLPAAIVLESDGAQNRGALQPDQAARRARAAGVRVYGVALGTPTGSISSGLGGLTGSPPDPAVVREISKITGGRAYTAHNATRLTSIYTSLGSSITHRTERHEITSWFAVAAAVFLLGCRSPSSLAGSELVGSAERGHGVSTRASAALLRGHGYRPLRPPRS